MKIKKILINLGLGILILATAFLAFVWFGTYHPADVEAMAVNCPASTPVLRAEQNLKVMTWNVQFMAGKNYTFWFDVPNNDGPDERPSPADISTTFSEVARVIKAENPDVILLDEVDNGAARTDYEDQLARLKSLLPPEYACSTSAYYWKAIYLPHPRIHAKVGLTLVVLSKYRIDTAERHQLALAPRDWISTQFNSKRAMLAAYLPVQQGGQFAAIATHLDAFAQGSNTMEQEVGQVDSLLSSLGASQTPFMIGGDFNLLPPDPAAYQRLPVAHQAYYNPQSEIKPLFERYLALPALPELTGADYAKWYTYLPNDPAIPYADSTLDYFFLSKNLTVSDHYVRQADTQKISDHFPLIAVIQLPK